MDEPTCDEGGPRRATSGRYEGVSQGLRSPFPHEGREVTLELDREAGIVKAQWVDDEGRNVVEIWRIRG